MQLNPIHKKFPSINQYRHAVKSLIHRYRYDGENEDGTVRYNSNPLPLVNFYGTVKAHGTNAAICQMHEFGKIFYQSRERLLTVGSDNHGFVANMSQIKNDLLDWMDDLRRNLHLPSGNAIYIYGEWCGGNIQSGVALHGLNTMFIVFLVRIINEDGVSYWIRPDHVNFSSCQPLQSIPDIYFINDFETYQIEVNLEYPELAQEKIIELVEQVEKECPIGKYFGKSGIGEGIVFAPDLGFDYAFKAKGKKHSSSKVRTVASVDIDRVTKLNDLVDLIVTENRLNQMIDGMTPIIKEVGVYLKKVFSDSLKEELDSIEGNGFTSKEFCGAASHKIKKFWFERCEA